MIDAGSTPHTLSARVALVGALLMLCLVGVSAYLRLSAAGLDCEPWPECYAEAAGAAGSQHHPVARLSHRVLASAVGIVVLLIAFAGFRQRAQRRAHFGTGLILVALTAALAVLGRSTPGSTSALVAAFNLLGGLALLSLLTWIALDAPHASATRSAAPRLAGAALGITALQAIAGALLSTTHAAGECASLIDCGTGSAAGALHLVHRLLGVIVVFTDVALGIWLWRQYRARVIPAALVILPLAQLCAGIALLGASFPLWLALAHNLLAALLLMTAVVSLRTAAAR
jgi:cytochrome c oxidase assembly protein subunit 15